MRTRRRSSPGPSRSQPGAARANRSSSARPVTRASSAWLVPPRCLRWRLGGSPGSPQAIPGQRATAGRPVSRVSHSLRSSVQPSSSSVNSGLPRSPRYSRSVSSPAGARPRMRPAAGRVVSGQPGQFHPLHPVDPAQFGQQRPQRMGAVQVVGTERDDDEHPAQGSLVAVRKASRSRLDRSAHARPR